MDETVPASAVCPSCDTPYDGVACPRCGESAAALPSAARAKKMRLEENPKLIVCVMVFAALFLGFPLLWRTPHMSLGAKIFWTVAVTLESILVFWLFFWLIWHYSIVPIRETLSG